MAIAFLSGLFLLYEFRDTFSNPIITASVNITIRRVLILIERSIAVLIFIITFIQTIRKGYKTGGAFFIVLCSVVWQMYIAVFVLNFSNYRSVTWICIFLFFVWNLYAQNVPIIKDVRKMIVLILILFLLREGLPAYIKAVLDTFRPYSGAEQAAAAIEALPDDAVIFEHAEDFCNAVIPYLKTKKVYNPFQEKIASYIDRNPKLRRSLSYHEFIAVTRRMFPGLKDFMLLVNVDGNQITDLKDHLLSEDIYYTDNGQKIILNERFTIYHIKLEQE